MTAMDGKRRTVSEVATRCGLDKETARGLVKFLEEVGVAQYVGDRRPEHTRGGLEKVYVFSDDLRKGVNEFFERASL